MDLDMLENVLRDERDLAQRNERESKEDLVQQRRWYLLATTYENCRYVVAKYRCGDWNALRASDELRKLAHRENRAVLRQVYVRTAREIEGKQHK